VMATNSKSRELKHRVSKVSRKAQSNQSRTQYNGRVLTCTIGLSIYKDLKLKKKEGESSGAV
jgi:hypothetical protein